MSRAAPALLVVLAALGVGACGGADHGASPVSGTQTTQGAPDGSAGGGSSRTIPLSPSRPGVTPSAPAIGSLALPSGVPTTEAHHGAPAADRHVINGWLRALRQGRIALAASYYSQPSKVQNGTPVLTLDSPTERLAFNLSLPCGARATSYGTNGPYTIVVFILTERRGGDCQGAAGHVARGAIRVQDGQITEWYRLADDPDADRSQPPLPPREPRVDPGDVNAV